MCLLLQRVLASTEVTFALGIRTGTTETVAVRLQHTFRRSLKKDSPGRLRPKRRAIYLYKASTGDSLTDPVNLARPAVKGVPYRSPIITFEQPRENLSNSLHPSTQVVSLILSASVWCWGYVENLTTEFPFCDILKVMKVNNKW